jgi:hypothetical protein
VNGCKQGKAATGLELTTSEMLEAAVARGFSLSEARLRRWRTAGLFIRGRRGPSRGQGRGRASRLYPADSLPHLLKICEIAERVSGVKAVGWELWWRGFSVDEKYWLVPLKLAAQSWDRHLGTLRPKVGVKHRSDVSAGTMELIDKLSRADFDQSDFRQIHKRLRGTGFDAVLLSLLRIATGVFDAETEWRDDYRLELQETFRRAFGLHRIEVDEVRSHLRLDPVNHQFDAPLTWLAQRLKGKIARDELIRSGEHAIIVARDELRKAMSLVARETASMRVTFGRRASSLNTVEAFARTDRKQTATHLLIWICLGYDAELRAGVREWIALSATRDAVAARSEGTTFSDKNCEAQIENDKPCMIAPPSNASEIF